MVEKKGSFQYYERDDELTRDRAKQKEGMNNNFDVAIKSGFKAFKPAVPEKYNVSLTNKIRILPPTWKDPEHYGVETVVHYKIGSSKSSFICNKAMKHGNGKCPICEAIEENKDDKKFINAVKPSRKVLVWLIDRNDEEAGPKYWLMPISVDRSIAFQSVDEDTDRVLKIDHPTKGYDIYFDTEKAPEDVGVPFTYKGEKVARSEKPIFSDEGKMKATLEFITEHPLPSILNFKEYDYIKDVFEGKVESNSGNEQEEVKKEKPKREEKEEEKEVKKEEVVTNAEVKSLKDMDRDELEDVAFDDLGMKRREVKAMDDDQLRKHIAKIMGVTGMSGGAAGNSAVEEARRRLSRLEEE